MNDLIQAKQATAIEAALVTGDLSRLTTEQRLEYYKSVCESLGLNPLTRPFDYITLNQKLTLYARKDATDQLRTNRKVSIYKLEREKVDDIYTVTAYARTVDGREDASVGAVSVGGLRGDNLANALMKTETKAKRRVTLSICGLGMLDETEIETIPNARVEPTMIEVTSTAPLAPAEQPQAQGNGHADTKPVMQATTPVFTEPNKVRVPAELATLLGQYTHKTYATPEKAKGARGLANGTLDEYAGDTERRHTFLMAIFGVDSSNKLTDGQVGALLGWKDHPSAKSEVNRVIADYLKVKGQTELFAVAQPA